MVVVDASAVIEVITELSPSPALEDLLLTERVNAPDVIDYEVASALRGMWLGSQLDEDTVSLACRSWDRFGVERHSLASSVSAILDLRHNFTAYDAAYVVLAKALRAPLVTADAKMLAAEKVGVEVLVF